MNCDKIIYHPYHTELFFGWVMKIIGVISLIIAGALWADVELMSFFAVLLEGLLSIGLAGWLHKCSRIMLIFEFDGVRIIYDRENKYCFIPWNSLCYRYYGRNSKGHEYLVLSPDVLNEKELKKLIQRGANSTKVHFEKAIVIHMDSLQDTSKIKEMVEEKIASK